MVDKRYALQKRLSRIMLITTLLVAITTNVWAFFTGILNSQSILFSNIGFAFIVTLSALGLTFNSLVIKYLQPATLLILGIVTSIGAVEEENIFGELIIIFSFYIFDAYKIFPKKRFVILIPVILLTGLYSYRISGTLSTGVEERDILNRAYEYISATEDVDESVRKTIRDFTQFAIDESDPIRLVINHLFALAFLIGVITVIRNIKMAETSELEARETALEERFKNYEISEDYAPIVIDYLHDEIGYLSLTPDLIQSISNFMEQKDYNSANERLEILRQRAELSAENFQKLLERGRNFYKPAREEINLSRLLKQLRSYYETYAVKKLPGLEFISHDDGSSPIITGVTSQISIAIDRVIKNSIDNYIEKGLPYCPIHTKTEIFQDSVKLSIWDEGGGLSFHKSGKVNKSIFQPGKTTKKNAGSGWGLYYAIKHVKANGGVVEFMNCDSGFNVIFKFKMR